MIAADTDYNMTTALYVHQAPAPETMGFAWKMYLAMVRLESLPGAALLERSGLDLEEVPAPMLVVILLGEGCRLLVASRDIRT